jgi:hypothetical protein
MTNTEKRGPAVLVGSNGGRMAGRSELHWRKSTRSNAGSCVEIAVSAEAGTVLMRDSKDPGGPVLEFPPAAFGALVADLKDERA